jgi:hypothetical protein
MNKVKVLAMGAIVALILLGLPLTLAADPRLEGMNFPTLNLSRGVPSSYTNIESPTDENGLGIPLIRSRYEVFKFPQNTADRELFPEKTVIFNYTGGTDGSGGLFLPFTLRDIPVGVGVYVNRPDQNGFVTGAPRSDLGFAASFGAEVIGSTDISFLPNEPQNMADIFFGAELSNGLRLGLGYGLAYNKSYDVSAEDVGVADSTIEEKATSAVIVARLGAGYDLDGSVPLAIDVGASAHIGRYNVQLTSGTNAFPANQDDSIIAGNMVFDVGTRISAMLRPTFDINFAGTFAYLPQNFDQVTDDGTEFDTTTEQIDDTTLWSAGGALGIAWHPKDDALVEAQVSGIYGRAKFVTEAPGAPPRPEDLASYLTVGGQIGAEFPLSERLTVRGGLGSSKTWDKFEDVEGTGGTDTTFKDFQLNTSAALGAGIKILDPVYLDFVVNLNNLTGSGAFQSLAFGTSVIAEF